MAQNNEEIQRTILPTEVENVNVIGFKFNFPILGAWEKIEEYAKQFKIFTADGSVVFKKNRIKIDFKG